MRTYSIVLGNRISIIIMIYISLYSFGRLFIYTKVYVCKAKAALQRATKNFQRATGIHRAAKETIDLAEERLREFKDAKVDQVWQEMLNKQTERFMEAEKDK